MVKMEIQSKQIQDSVLPQNYSERSPVLEWRKNISREENVNRQWVRTARKKGIVQ